MLKEGNKKRKLHIRTGDTVKVLSGNNRGKTGKVLKVYRNPNRAVVEGLNMITKHVKPSAENTEGGRQQKEAPIHISNLMVVDPKSGEATRIGRKLNEKGKLQRYSKRTGDIISNG